MELQVEYVSIDSIKPYEGNAKEHPQEQIEQIKKSIQEFGFNDPLAIWKNKCVCGHGRLLAAKELGFTKLPIIRLDHLTDEQRKAYTLIHNQLTMNTGFDVEALESELASISDIDMSEYGFDIEKELGGGTGQVEEDDFDEEPPEEPTSKLGDIYQLGESRLMCGDSTNPEHVAKLMDGAKADMVFTDSPYGVNIVNDKGKVGADNLAKNGVYAPVIGDDTTETAQQAYDIYSQLCDKMILWGGNYFLDFLPPSDGWLIWDKRGESGIRNNFADGEMAWCSFHTPVRIYHQLWNGMIREGEHEKRVHPTQKPIRMLCEILQDFTNEGDNILDVFGGSGSTLIACEQLGRKCYMMEMSPKYVDVIINRWETYTGKKAEKIC